MGVFKSIIKRAYYSVRNKALDLAFEDTVDAKSRKYIYGWNISNTVSANLVAGNFLVSLYTILMVDDRLLGVLSAIGQLCNIIQIFAPILLARFEKKKGVIIVLRGIYLLCNILIIGLIPFLPAEQGFKMAVLVAAMFLGNFSAAMASPAINMVHIKSIPNRMRAEFFSIMHILDYAFLHAFVLLGSKIVDSLRDSGHLLTGITIVRAIALVFALLETICSWKIHEFPEDEASKSRPAIKIGFGKSRRFAVACILAAAWSFIANMPSLYYNSYLINDLHVPMTFISTAGLIAFPFMIVMSPVWTKIINKTSWFTGLAMATVLNSMPYWINGFITAENYRVLYILSYMFSQSAISGMNIGFSNLPHITLPDRDRMNYMAFYSANNCVWSMLGMLFGSLWYTLTKDTDITLFGQVFQTKQYMSFFVAIVVMIIGILFFVFRKLELSKAERAIDYKGDTDEGKK